MKPWLFLGATLVVLACLALLARGCETVTERGAPRPPRAVPEPPPPEPEPVPPPPKPKPPPPPPPPPPPSKVESVEAVKAPQGGGIIRGTVRLFGERPRPPRIRMAVDPKCAALHPGAIPSDTLVVDREGRVKGAFIYVDKGPLEPKYTPPMQSVLLDQVGCRFKPHVLGIMTGQPLLIRNSDPLLHNVHALPFHNREFNFGQHPTLREHVFAGRHVRSDDKTRTFTEPEIMIRIKCDIHPWMSAWVGVLDHPYYAVSNDLGQYAIRGLPPGRFQVKLWHEKLSGRLTAVDVPEGGEAVLDFNLLERK